MTQGPRDDPAEEQPSPVGCHQAAAFGPPVSDLSQSAERGRSRQAVRQEGDQTQRDHQRCRKREQNRERDYFDQLAHHWVFEVDDKKWEEDGRGRGTGGDDRPHRATQPLTHGGRRFGAALQSALHRLVDHHAVVDQQSDRERQTEQDDQVERLTDQIQHRQRRQQAHRDRHRNDSHGPPLAQEEEEHHQRHGEPGGAESGQSVQLVFHDLGGIEADHQVDALGPQLLLDHGHALT